MSTSKRERPFSKVLVANRGEIACRVIRSAHGLGYDTVAVYSEADAGALHVRAADQAVCIGPPPARESYLAIDRILAAARRTGADAVHPGYGFLAENAAFAEACEKAGLVFIGPPPAAIRAMGNKAAAKIRMREAGVPCVPGYDGDDQSVKTLAAEARKIGFPVLIKAVAGGGGRGMRLVTGADELEGALTSARSEAESAFGDGTVMLERALQKARHVEIQIMADGHGHVVHLGERDCSVQRRHQKVIEESPSPAVTPAIRSAMGEAAVRAAAAIGYVGAGTVEFMLDADGSFYFLEMNTRIQVEHPVTELVTRTDLVDWQLRVASGEELPVTQDQIHMSGHAIEARLYAEDPYNGFLPQTGEVLAWQPATGPRLRVDHGIAAGQAISSHYDSMIAKIIAYGRDRDTARRRLMRALRESVVLGLTTNRSFLLQALGDEVFAAGGATTHFIEERSAAGVFDQPASDGTMLALAAVLLAEPQGGFRTSSEMRWPITVAAAAPIAGGDADRHSLQVLQGSGRTYSVTGDIQVADGDGGGDRVVEILAREGDTVRFNSAGVQHTAHFARATDGTLHLQLGATDGRFVEIPPVPESEDAAGDPTRLVAPMNGVIVAVHAGVGDAVEVGQTLVTVEAMKMETPVAARIAGSVARVAASPGTQVTAGQVLVELEAASEDAGDVSAAG